MALRLPPLTALRAFEAAARSGSYVAAGDEIGISSAAVSQHVRKLEAFLGKELFVRHNNRIVLPDAGRIVFEGAHAGLHLIADMTEQTTQTRRGSRLVISCIESIADQWLVPEVVRYARDNPDFRFDLRMEPDPIDFARDDIDIRLAYDPSHYPDQTIVPLASDVVLPLCSPAYLARNPDVRAEGMAGVPYSDLLHIDWGPSFGSRPTWEQWFAFAGLPEIGNVRGSRVGSSAIALAIAREGFGVVLGQKMVARHDLATGDMIALSEVALPLRHPYCLDYPRAKQHKHHLPGLVEHLRRRWDATE